MEKALVDIDFWQTGGEGNLLCITIDGIYPSHIIRCNIGLLFQTIEEGDSTEVYCSITCFQQLDHGDISVYTNHYQ
jgi:hypothetical protein